MLKEKYPNHKITAIFQPHQMHRVLTGRKDFQPALELFDEVAIYHIYAAREKIEDFAQEPLFQQHNFQSVDELGKFFADENNTTYLSDFSAFQEFLSQRSKNEVVVIFTAGELDFQVRKSLGLFKK